MKKDKKPVAGPAVDFSVGLLGDDSQGQGVEVQPRKKSGRPSKLPWDRAPKKAAGQRRGQGQPKKKKPPAAATVPGAPSNNSLDYIYGDNIDIEELKELIQGNNPDFKSAGALGEALSDKELKFLEIYLSANVPVESAMIQAGYVGYKPGSLYTIARRVVQKYEAGAGSGPKALRAVGLGELKIAILLKRLAESAKSEVVRLEAVKFAANCLGMSKVDESYFGFQIAFNPPGAQPDKPGGAPAASPAVPVQVKAVQITR